MPSAIFDKAVCHGNRIQHIVDLLEVITLLIQLRSAENPGMFTGGNIHPSLGGNAPVTAVCRPVWAMLVHLFIYSNGNFRVKG